jgi:hypothetical protein
VPCQGSGSPRLASQPTAAQTEQVGDGARLAVGEQDGVYALLQARAVVDEMQPPARAFALGTHARVGQPDRRDEVAAGELGQHPGVDPVGLARQRREPLHLLRIGDLDLPAVKLEAVVDKAGAVHRLDRRADRVAVSSEALAQVLQTISIRR